MSDTIERAALALRLTAVPALPEGLLAAVATGAAAEVRRLKWRKRMRYASVCGMAACLAVMAGLLPGGKSAQAALQEALEKQEHAKSYKCVQTTTGADSKVMPERGNTIYYADGMERDEKNAGSYFVSDLASGRSVWITPKAKTVAILQTDPADALPRRNTYTVMLEGYRKSAASGAKFEQLPATDFGGRKLKGYRHSGEKVGDLTPSSTFWLDTKDGTLVRYVVANPTRVRMLTDKNGKSMQVGKPTVAAETMVMEFSDFGKPIDPKLFDMSVPNGYKDVSKQTFTVKPPPLPAKKPKQ